MKEQLINSGVSLAEIGGASCAACYALMPSAREVAQKLGITFYYFDSDGAADLIEEWGITSVPALVLSEGGKKIACVYGYQPPEILEIWLESKLKEHTNGKH